jgi:hypothetical protein
VTNKLKERKKNDVYHLIMFGTFNKKKRSIGFKKFKSFNPIEFNLISIIIAIQKAKTLSVPQVCCEKKAAKQKNPTN